MAQTGYASRANTYLELLDAQQVYRTEQSEYARALAAFNVARAALEAIAWRVADVIGVVRETVPVDVLRVDGGLTRFLL